MARYSSRLGPPAQQGITTTATPIAGLTIKRWFDGGPIILLAAVFIQQGASPTPPLTANVQIDGSQAGLPGATIPPTANAPQTISMVGFAKLTEGAHTIDLMIQTNAATTAVVVAGISKFAVIELPEWDSDGDLA